MDATRRHCDPDGALMLQSATVTRIASVTPTTISPAIAEVRTTDGETFPVFDSSTSDDATAAYLAQSLVLLHLAESAIPPHPTYLRTLTMIDERVGEMPCPWCVSVMARLPTGDSGGVPQFFCLNCARRIYLERPPAVAAYKPMTARARLDVTTDGVFALDYLHATATLMDTCRSTAPSVHPFRGAPASLSPTAERSLPNDGWKIGMDYRRWMGAAVTLTLADGQTFEVL